MVAIDVNSGKYRDNRDAEMTAYKTNLEAADEVCRQLRLRDLGGHRQRPHRHAEPQAPREIEQRFRENLKHDRAHPHQPDQPVRRAGDDPPADAPSLKKSLFIDCPVCRGAASVKSAESWCST